MTFVFHYNRIRIRIRIRIYKIHSFIEVSKSMKNVHLKKKNEEENG